MAVGGTTRNVEAFSEMVAEVTGSGVDVTLGAASCGKTLHALSATARAGTMSRARTLGRDSNRVVGKVAPGRVVAAP